jgi:hypothetical protein
MRDSIKTILGISALVVGVFICMYLYSSLGAYLFKTIEEPTLSGVTAPIVEPIVRPIEEEIMTVKIAPIDEASLKTKYGNYVQVTKDGRVLDGDTHVSEPDFISKLPPNTEVTVYGGPQGEGYEVITKTATQIIHTGYGGEAKDRTYTIDIPTPIASST